MATSMQTRRPSGRPSGSGPLFSLGRPDDPSNDTVVKIRSLVLAVVLMMVAGAAFVPLFLPAAKGAELVIDAYNGVELPPPDPGGLTSYLFDGDGKPLTSLHAEVDRTPVPLSRVPEHMIQALLAAEDAGFYEHGGVSPMSILRAAWLNFARGEVWQGGSTLTEQYVKNVYGEPGQRTVGQKLDEAIYAMKLERVLTKDQILSKYLNSAYFGQGAYGIYSAAQIYFSKDPRELTIPEAALLAGIIPRPGAWDPVTSPQAAVYRRNFVLQRMAKEGYITDEQAAAFQREDLNLQLHDDKLTAAPYFVTEAKSWLEKRFGIDATFSGGLRVTTTIDMEMQRQAEQAVKNWLQPDADTPSGALVAIDPRTGEVKALVGDARHLGPWKVGRFNLATDAHRQTGSAFKPFTLAAAMEDRISLSSTWDGPSTIEIDDPQCDSYDAATGSWEPWRPVNAGDSGVGHMSLLSATTHSVNTIYAQLVVTVGPADVAEIAHRMGVRSQLNPYCAITLGSNDVTVLDMATGYATLAARGVRRYPRFVKEVRDRQGDVLYELKDHGEQAILPNDADLVTYALETVIQSGTGRAAYIGRPAAGKTGSGEENTNAYFCGYVPQLVACVWVGFPSGLVPMLDDYYGGPVYGGTIPAQIWQDFMSAATAGMPVVDFVTPSFSGYDVYPEGSGTSVDRPTTASPTGEPTRTRTPKPTPTETRTRPPTTEPPPPTTTVPPPPTTEPAAGMQSAEAVALSTAAPPGEGMPLGAAVLAFALPVGAGLLRLSTRAARRRTRTGRPRGS